MEDIGVGFSDRFEEEGKAALMARHQNWRSAGDAIISCQLVNMPSDGLVRLLSAATGWDLALPNLLEVGERILNLKRVLNLRWGLKPKDEKLPGLLTRPLEDGGTAGYVPDVDRLLSDYYQARDWDRETGKPSVGKLRELGLDGLVGDLS
jgi:aldehyde:ferredoxin oxidoreductase